jgi:hypothetical protein
MGSQQWLVLMAKTAVLTRTWTFYLASFLTLTSLTSDSSPLASNSLDVSGDTYFRLCFIIIRF